MSLAEDHYYLVDVIVRRMRKSVPGDPEDMRQVGMEALVKAARRYDPDIGDFQAYARIRIQGAIIDLARLNCWVPRSIRARERAGESLVTYRAAVVDFERTVVPAHSVIDDIDRRQKVDGMNQAISMLQPSERDVVLDRLDGILISDTADRMSVTTGRISQIYSAAVERLQRSLDRAWIQEP